MKRFKENTGKIYHVNTKRKKLMWLHEYQIEYKTEVKKGISWWWESVLKHPVLNVYIPNKWAPKYRKLKIWRIDKPKIIIGDFNKILSVIDGTNRQKICKDIESLSHATNQCDLIDLYRILNRPTVEYTFS